MRVSISYSSASIIAYTYRYELSSQYVFRPPIVTVYSPSGRQMYVLNSLSFSCVVSGWMEYTVSPDAFSME